MPRQKRCDQSDRANRDTASKNTVSAVQFALRVGAVDVFDQCGRGHQKLGRNGRHDGGEDRCKHEACDEGVEEQLPEADEDAFGVRELSFVMLVDGDADNCCHACANHGQEHPTDTDATTLLSLRGRTQCHKADDDVRLTEVAEAPRERRHDAEDCCAGQGAFTVSE